MAVEGQLQDVSLADICQLLSMGRKTGCLTVTDRSNFGYIYFEQGRIVYATVLNRPDRLGELLVRNEVITREALAAAMEEQAQRPGRRLGQILIESTQLTEEQLRKFISVQIEEAVYHLFTWEWGSFHFEPDQRPDEDDTMLVSMNPESLLLEGARRVDEWSLIEKKIPSRDLIFRVERSPGELADAEIELTSDQEKIFDLLDGERTVGDVVSTSGLVEFDVMKALYGLLQAGFIQTEGRRRGTEPDEEVGSGIQQHLSLGGAYYRAGMLEDSEREYSAALEIDASAVVARERLAVIALRGDRPEEALAHFDALPEPRGEGAAILLNRAFALEKLSRNEEALDALNRAVEIRPEDRASALARAILLFKNRKSELASEAFRRYRDLLDNGEEPEPMYFAYAVLAAAAEGDTTQAMKLGREGLTLYPISGPILVNLGVVLERRGETDAAEALYLRAVAESPPPPQAHKNLGDLAYRRGDQAGARAHYERAVRLDPVLGDDTYLKLGNLAYKDGDPEWALELWQRALELNPENAVVRTNLELVTRTPGR